MVYTNKTLKGAYGYAIYGDAEAEASPPAVGPCAVCGFFTFDGIGKLTGPRTVSYRGQIGVGTTVLGTYQVQADGTGTAEFTVDGSPARHLWFVIIDGGAEIRFIQTDPGTVLAGSAKR